MAGKLLIFFGIFWGVVSHAYPAPPFTLEGRLVRERDGSLFLQTTPSIVYPLMTRSRLVEAQLGLLKHEDLINADVQPVGPGASLEVISVNFVGLSEILGKWLAKRRVQTRKVTIRDRLAVGDSIIDPTAVFFGDDRFLARPSYVVDFVDFSQLMFYIDRNHPPTSYQYLIAPTSSHDWHIFFNNPDTSVLLGELTLPEKTSSASYAQIRLYDAMGEVCEVLDLEPLENVL